MYNYNVFVIYRGKRVGGGGGGCKLFHPVCPPLNKSSTSSLQITTGSSANLLPLLPPSSLYSPIHHLLLLLISLPSQLESLCSKLSLLVCLSDNSSIEFCRCGLWGIASARTSMSWCMYTQQTFSMPSKCIVDMHLELISKRTG